MTRGGDGERPRALASGGRWEWLRRRRRIEDRGGDGGRLGGAGSGAVDELLAESLVLSKKRKKTFRIRKNDK
jgi:hypothetical protein